MPLINLAFTQSQPPPETRNTGSHWDLSNKSAEENFLTVSTLGFNQRATWDFRIPIIAMLLIKGMFFAHIFLSVFHQTIHSNPFIPTAAENKHLRTKSEPLNRTLNKTICSIHAHLFFQP